MNKKYFWSGSLLVPLIGMLLSALLSLFDRFFISLESAGIIIQIIATSILYLHLFYKTTKEDSLGKSIGIFFAFAVISALAGGIYASIILVIASITGVYLGDMAGLAVFIVPIYILGIFGITGIFTLIFRRGIANSYDFANKKSANLYVFGILTALLLFILLFPAGFLDSISVQGHTTSLALRDALLYSLLISALSYPLFLFMLLLVINIFMNKKNLEIIKTIKKISIVLAILGYLSYFTTFIIWSAYSNDILRIIGIGTGLIGGISLFVFIASYIFLKNNK